jgi:hypothetical protein
MGHARVQLAVKLLIRPVTPARAGADNPMRTSPQQDTKVSQNSSHAPSHRPQHTTNAAAAATDSQSEVSRRDLPQHVLVQLGVSQ